MAIQKALDKIMEIIECENLMTCNELKLVMKKNKNSSAKAGSLLLSFLIHELKLMAIQKNLKIEKLIRFDD